MLYVFGGLPATGKSTLSVRLARDLEAMHLRIDSIEQALKEHGAMDAVGIAGYVSAYAIAADNLALGRTVIADSVNPIEVTRAAWRQVAEDAGVPCCEIEVVCSDVALHERRYRARRSDIAGLEFPPWQAVLDRDYEPWDAADLRIDTARGCVDDAVDALRAQLCAHRPG